MIETHIGDYPETLTDEQIAFFDKQSISTFSKVMSDADIIAGRFAYNRIWDANPVNPEDKDASAIPGGQSMTIKNFCHEAALVKHIANDYSLKMVAAALHAPIEDLVYVQGWIGRQGIMRQWDYEDWYWDGWHQDDSANLDPFSHCNVWLYFNDCTREEGATQALINSCEAQRQEIYAGKAERAEEEGRPDCIEKLIDSVGTDPEKGSWAEAPAGGGFIWGGFLWHRISPNRSGKNRTLVTYEYELRSPGKESAFKEQVSAEQKQAMMEWLPENRHHLIDY